MSTVVTQTRLEPQVREHLAALAEENERTVASEVRLAVRRHIQAETTSVATEKGDPEDA